MVLMRLPCMAPPVAENIVTSAAIDEKGSGIVFVKPEHPTTTTGVENSFDHFPLS
jgi:hypothetical protein